ncbi:MAG: hypothetical protein OEO83_10575 [Alphaproteobacteria bacterium]|nr:hypothetical protein [Alphaproteobacteria bacterium]
MTARLKRFAILIALLLPLGGCVGFTLAKGGEPIDMGDGVSVQPPRDWNRMSIGKYEYWTLDGLRLQNILFVKGVEDGENIVFRRARNEEPEKDTFPKFKKGMTLLDIRELLETTWARQEFHRTRVTKFGPAKFGGRDGFEMIFTFDTKDGLEMRGWAVGAVVGERLFMAIYRGTRIHFYERGEKDFRKIIGSYRFPARPSS